MNAHTYETETRTLLIRSSIMNTTMLMFYIVELIGQHNVKHDDVNVKFDCNVQHANEFKRYIIKNFSHATIDII
jgi:hypothetical protein